MYSGPADGLYTLVSMIVCMCVCMYVCWLSGSDRCHQQSILPLAGAAEDSGFLLLPHLVSAVLLFTTVSLSVGMCLGVG